MGQYMYWLYVDMDGVLVDFNKGYFELTGIDIAGTFRSDYKFWKPIDDAGVKFWSDLEWTVDGKHLWNYIKNYNPKILSAPSREIDSRIGKIKWVEREIPQSQVIFKKAEEKKHFASPTSILIDDRKENVDGWIEAGGIGILHKDTQQTIKQLKELGL